MAARRRGWFGVARLLGGGRRRRRLPRGRVHWVDSSALAVWLRRRAEEEGHV